MQWNLFCSLTVLYVFNSVTIRYVAELCKRKKTTRCHSVCLCITRFRPTWRACVDPRWIYKVATKVNTCLRHVDEKAGD